MPKNIVLCSDGTANAGGNGDVSNVWRIYNAVDMTGLDDLTQVAMHDDGVGTETFLPIKLIGRMFGYGLKRNVRDLYHFLIRNYEPGEENQIYIFGFSRGAYTARVLAELISICGIINPRGKTDTQVKKEIDEAFEILTNSILASADENTKIAQIIAKFMRYVKRIDLVDRIEFIDNKCHPVELMTGPAEKSTPYLIRFLGVWDTVPAYGFPVEWLANFWNRYIYPYMFSDRRLHKNIRRAVHALAVDEERETFRPMLFDQTPELNKDLPSDRVEQVWFPGVHANIGGGYPKDGLALISLYWMMQKAEQTLDGIPGLRFISSLRDEYTSRINSSAKIYDSRAGLAVFYRYEPRDIKLLSAENGIFGEQNSIKIHSSVIQRVLARTERYAPGNIPATASLEMDCSCDTEELEEVMLRYKNSNAGFHTQFSDVEPLVKLRKQLQLSKIIMLLLALTVVFRTEIVNALNSLGIIDGTNSVLECSNGWLTDIGEFIGKLMPMVPLGEAIHANILFPILSCNSLTLIFIGGSFAIWYVGFITKQRIIRNHSDFWTTFLN